MDEKIKIYALLASSKNPPIMVSNFNNSGGYQYIVEYTCGHR